jgi:hypothetical protein
LEEEALMFFILSKSVAFFLLPSNLLIAVGLAGLILLAMRRKRAGICMVASSLILLALVGFLFFPVIWTYESVRAYRRFGGKGFAQIRQHALRHRKTHVNRLDLGDDNQRGIFVGLDDVSSVDQQIARATIHGRTDGAVSQVKLRIFNGCHV